MVPTPDTQADAADGEPAASLGGASRIERAAPDLAPAKAWFWSLAVVVIFGLVAAAVLTVRAVQDGPHPPFLVQPAVDLPRDLARQDPGVLRLAGSGGNLPLTRALADAYVLGNPKARVVVHTSIGSTGGVRAAYDGAVDIGLSSRELTPEERAMGLRVVPYARVAVVFAANPGVPISGMSQDEVVALYRGDEAVWSDGTAVVVLQREKGDSSHLVAAQAVSGFRGADEQALAGGRWRVLYSDSAMREALASTTGALGLIDQGVAVSGEGGLRILSLDGVRATESTVRDGSYPMSKPLAFVVDTDPNELAEDFLRFVASPGGTQIIRANGYIPLGADAQ